MKLNLVDSDLESMLESHENWLASFAFSRSTRYVCIERVSFGVQDMLTDVAVG